MSTVRRGSLRNVETAIYYRAVCALCGESVDEDGEEYAVTPEEAVQVALDHDWLLGNDGLLRCWTCLNPDEDEALAEADARAAGKRSTT